MSASNASENAILLLLFNNTNWANVGDATGLRGSTGAGSWYVSLHTADPGEAGDQTTSESAYTNYARVAVARSAAGWTITGTAPTTASNTSPVTFAACGATGSTVTYFGIGWSASTAGQLLASGQLTSQLIINSGITPSFTTAALVVSLD